MSLDYARITTPQFLEDWDNRLLADDRFKQLSQASIYRYLQESIAAIGDTSNFYLGRVAEEAFQSTARLDSSHIKHAKNFGYQPRRAVPSKAEIKIELHGPLPSTLKAGDEIWLNNETMRFTFDSHDYLLDRSYSYKLTAEDIANGSDASWTKTLIYSKNSNTNESEYYTIDERTTLIAQKSLFPINIFQGTIKTEEIKASSYADRVGTVNQWYDIDDIKFSNYYGKRDPFAYLKGDYNPSYGLCKVGIGDTAEEAFSTENICDIEEFCIELNDKLKSWDTTQSPLNIVHIETNPDKTVRIHFGNGNNIAAGFTNTKQSLWVQYLACDGSVPNKSGTTDSQLQCSNTIYATGGGRVVNITSNIKFLFNSDIAYGDDFEDQARMVINSKLHFASRGNLLTLADFKGYFQTLTQPFVVNHALAFGENQYDGNNTDQPWLMNNILYCLFGDIYHNYDTGKYAPINVFDNDEKLNNVMIYNTKDIYTAHLWDLVKLRLYPKTFKDRQYADATEFGLNVKRIRTDCQDRMLLNTNIISITPVFHYYDVVGKVVVDKHKDMATYSSEVEEKLYSWLNEQVTFNTPIYKSDISNKLHELDATKKTNIDIKVSSLIAENTQSNPYRNVDCTWNYDTSSASVNYYNAISNGTDWNYKNQIKIPLKDLYGRELGTVKSLKGKQLKIEWDINNGDTIENHTARTPNVWYTIEKVEADDDYLYIKLLGDGIDTVTNPPSTDLNAYTRIYMNLDSYSMEGNYNLLSADFREALTNWLEAKVMKVGTTERPIDLPYIIDAISTNVRTETIQRRGANDISLAGLNENSFYNFIAEYVRAKVGNNASVDSFTTYQNDLNNVYPLLKAAFSDSVLDDNNNIVNYSCSQEIPVVRLQLDYVYEE